MTSVAVIFGTAPAAESAKAIHAMVERLRQESGGNSGLYVDEQLAVALGWVTQGVVEADHGLVWNESKEIGVLMCGQVFSGPDLLKQYQKQGIDCVQDLNGWFSGVLLDRRQGRCFVFNDPYGLQRLYYHEDGNAAYFASKAKALLKVLSRTRQLDMRSVGEQISCGAVLQNRSLFKDIRLLPSGSVWTLGQGRKFEKRTYFSKESLEGQALLTARQYCDSIKDVFPSILPRYLAGKSLGMSLTGGLDGRMIMAWARQPAGTLPCYTFGGSYRTCRDVRIARNIARACGQPHRVIPVNGDFLGQFPQLARRSVSLSDGTMDVTGAVELYANRLARDIAPVRLTGNYGSEILRGSVAFGPRACRGRAFVPEFQKEVEAAAGTYGAERQCHPVSFIAFKQVPWFHYARFSIEQSEIAPRSPFLDRDILSLAYRAPRAALMSSEASFELIAAGNPALARIPTDRALAYPPRPVLTRLNNLYQEFTVRAEYAYDYGMPQWLARFDRAVSTLRLERLFLGRHKFYHFRTWYRNQLAGFVRETLLSSQTLARPYLEPNEVKRMVEEHTSGKSNYTCELHHLLTLELIHQELLEAQ